jgi:hypothetical protein
MAFLASQNLNLVNSKGKEIIVDKGKEIPDEFVRTFLLHNRNFIDNLPYKDGIPVLTEEQEKKYNIKFGILPAQLGLQGKVKGDKYTQEKLTNKLNDLGTSKFKIWAEDECGKDIIDRRKSAKNIIVQILELQEKGRR